MAEWDDDWWDEYNSQIAQAERTRNAWAGIVMYRVGYVTAGLWLFFCALVLNEMSGGKVVEGSQRDFIAFALFGLLPAAVVWFLGKAFRNSLTPKTKVKAL